MSALPNHPLWRVLQIDEQNRNELSKLLTLEGLLPLYERVPQLFERLPAAVQARNQEMGSNPFERETPQGPVRTWDFALRVFMAQSASAQFLHATGHLLRGHSLEIFGHARTMIENSGVAYLSTKEPDLADAYLDISRRQEYKSRTARAKILPTTDPKTTELNDAFGIASRTFHSNFVSIAGRMNSEFSEADGKVSFSSEMKFHDIDPYDTRQFLMHGCWLIGTASLVLQLFAASFRLEASSWGAAANELRSSVAQTCGGLRPRIFGPKQGPTLSGT